MGQDRALYAQLSQQIDPAGLCHELRKRKVRTRTCNHTRRHTRAILAQYHVTGERLATVEGLLSQLGGVCDCEIALNLCGRLWELEEIEHGDA